jgi:hypothetical protein
MRADTFRSADRRELDAMVRIAVARLLLDRWRARGSGCLLLHFPTWAKARAMQHWIDRSGIAAGRCPHLSTARRCEATQALVKARLSERRRRPLISLP